MALPLSQYHDTPNMVFRYEFFQAKTKKAPVGAAR